MLHLIEATKSDEYHVVNIDLDELRPKDWIINHLDCSQQYRITSIGDERYGISHGYCGLPILRFCGDYVDHHENGKAAFYAAMSHKAERECTAQSAVDFLSTVQ